MQELLRYQDAINRRTFLSRSASGLGLTALASLTARDARAGDRGGAAAPQAGIADLPHFPPKVKRVIYLFQSGAPSQMDLYDYKPSLEKHRGLNLPDSIRKGQRLTGMTSGQATFPVAPSMFKFNRNPRSGTWMTELLPRIGAMSDQIAVIRSMHTDAINHDPAITFFQTGQQIAGRPSIGSWLAYGLGSENEDLPAYVVLTSKGTGRSDDQPLYDRLWGSGFLPTQYQGVKFRNNGDPVLYLSDPPGISRGTRRDMLDELRDLNQMRRDATGDPEITTRILQYEMAFRMQTSVPDLIDIKQEPARVLEAYGPNVRKTGSYAYNCLLARRLAERGVRFIQLFHMGWDQHFNLPKQIRGQCSDVDQPTAALLQDLQQRGLLEDTLVVWGGEFGRTVYSQGKLSVDDYGRDHHPRCFTIWMAGGGVKQGITHGETDDFCYNIVRDPVSVHDLHATILRLLGIDHERFTYKFQGLDARLSGVEKCRVVKEILA
ncbi:MAG: DUF1501 domain-containing protein [Planctomycetota bacterium]|nr:DUF1501 domain-containing protein [Planctomycetota bacterium]